MILIAITYNLASITKMGYKDTDNNEIFVKVRCAQDEDDEGEKGEPAQDPVVLTLGQIMDVLGDIQLNLSHINSRFNSMDEHLDSLGAQVAAIDRKVRLGVVWKSYMVIQLSCDHQKPPNHLPMHDHYISFAFHQCTCTYWLIPLPNSF